MRKYFFLLIFTQCLSIFSQNIDSQSKAALNHMQKGFVAYGVEELKKAAMQNTLAAQYYLAFCYEHNIYVEKNLEKAFVLYRRAAERGLPDAMYHLASCYRKGIGVPINERRHNEWIERYNRKGGSLTLPDINSIYHEGLKYPTNYALSPNGSSNNRDTGSSNLQQNIVNHVTIVQNLEESKNHTPEATDITSGSHVISNVDNTIPVNLPNNTNTFALILANENYQNAENVINAENDGNIFAKYCEKTLGIPNKNIHLCLNATYNNIKREITLMKQIANAYHGACKFIFYYAGHGLPSETSKGAYIMPIDGYSSDITTCYSLNLLYRQLGEMSAKQIVVILDACFSGSIRGEGMIASARGVAIKIKQSNPTGNMVVFTAAQGDETAYPYKEEGHGLFTYYLLKKLQETKGDVTLGELGEYIKTQVERQSIVVNGKLQSPAILPASSIGNDWKEWKLIK